MQEAAERFGHLEAVVDGDRGMTFAEVAEAVDGMQHALIGWGVRPGDRVAIWAPNGLEWVLLSFAIYGAGAVLVPINTRYKGVEAAHVLETAGVTLLFTVTDFLGTDYLELLAAAVPDDRRPPHRRDERRHHRRRGCVGHLSRAGYRCPGRGGGVPGEQDRGR